MHGYRPDYADGIPTLTNFFELPFFIEAYAFVKDSRSLTEDQRRQIETGIAEGAGDDLGASIVSVQTDLPHQQSQFRFAHVPPHSRGRPVPRRPLNQNRRQITEVSW